MKIKIMKLNWFGHPFGIFFSFVLFGFYYGLPSAAQIRDRNVAIGAVAYEEMNPNETLVALTDGKASTCSKTVAKRFASIKIDLNDTYVINKISILTARGEELRASSDFYIGRGPYDHKGVLCNIGQDGVNPVQLSCFSGPYEGNFIRLTERYNPLNICEVGIYECLEGYFGANCTKDCHCDGSVGCDKVAGKCPSGICAPGWNGTGCQQACSADRFGRNCKNTCHCSEGLQCHIATGICPGGKCASGWFGSSCQTSIPVLRGYPAIYSETDSSLTIAWTSWEQLYDPGLILSYMVLYKHGDSSGGGGNDIGKIVSGSIEDVEQNTTIAMAADTTTVTPVMEDIAITELTEHGWIVGPEVKHAGNKYNYQATVAGLNHNSFYSFVIMPRLTLTDGSRVYGKVTEQSPFYRTKCKAPEDPQISNITTFVDHSHGPAQPVITVYWTSLTDEQSNCEKIIFYEIYYEDTSQAQTSSNQQWLKKSALSDASRKNVSGDLSFETNYRLKICAVNNFPLESCSGVVILRTEHAPPPSHDSHTSAGAGGGRGAGIISGIVVCLLAMVLILSVVFIYRQRYSKRKERRSEMFSKRNESQLCLANEISHSSELDDLISQVVVRPSSLHASVNNNVFSNVGDFEERFRQLECVSKKQDRLSVADMEKIGNPIPRENFVSYVNDRRKEYNRTLKIEFIKIPTENPEATKVIGHRQENMSKNRFKDVIAYDHTRVRLHGDENSDDMTTDYINANYIDGYNKTKAYIATQGCKKNTIIDFWNMVWQEDSRRIVMVTNLIERSSIKCHQYWPDNEGTSRHYGDVKVTLTDVIKTTYFTIRTLEVTRYGARREVKQFHFTAWPDQGVPSKMNQILTFRNKVRSCDASHPGVIVVHCSAGIGRTGAFIALDILMEQLDGDTSVDVMKTTAMLRMQRCNMIQRPEQYIFVYNALSESLKVGSTLVSSGQFKSYYDSLKKIGKNKTTKSGLQKQFDLLEDLVSESTSGLTSANGDELCMALQPENVDKNRYSDIVPDDKSRPYLTSIIEGTNDYINAVYLDGYHTRNAYVITQMPLPTTVIDFWRLVFEHESRIIIMLNSFNDEKQQTYGQYWPEENEESECGPFLVQSLGVRIENNICIRDLQLSCVAEVLMNSSLKSRYDSSPRQVTLLQMSSLEHDFFLSAPSSPSPPLLSQPRDLVRCVGADLSHLIELVNEESSKVDVDLPVIVHCDDGQTLSGLFVAISHIHERVKVEKEVDILQTVWNLKTSRRGVVPSLNQYHFCYEMASLFLNTY